ncbi:MAG TPA: serine/threonine-protein kinase [Planctomycetaceae bacterium]|nr:serine/threonine-protein kinase [Planctomycetaceae bacterium]
MPIGNVHQQCLSAADAVEVDALIGTDFDDYRIEKLIGAGAMGRVYLARHQALHRSVAVKILPPRLAVTNPDYLSRFSNEARAAAALNHPNVITIHAIGEVRGFHYIETEFIAGQSLGHLIRSSGPLTPERATSIAALIAEGLAAAHTTGILHRDLKPDNVLMTHQGVPKVADFGLANRVHMHGAEAVGDLVGTPAYMAPELFQGHPASPTSDVYALGVCYFEMLTGRLPFPQKSAKDVIQASQHDPVPNPKQWCKSLPLEMAECLFCLLSKAAGNRPVDAIAAAHLLRAVLGEVADLETLVRDAFANSRGITWKKVGERFQVDLSFVNGRKQTVFVESTGHAVAERLLRIRSVCGKADPKYFETALKLNGEILHGALCVEDCNGEAVFTMVDSYPRATVDAEEIRRSVVEVAQRADAVERLLSTADQY